MKKLTALLLTGATVFAGVAGLTGCTAQPESDNPIIGEGPFTEYENNEKRFTKTKVSDETVYFDDSKERTDISISVFENKGGMTLYDYVSSRGIHSDGCWDVYKYKGIDVGINTTFSEENGEPVFIKKYSTIRGKNIFTKSYIYHTNEIRIGDSDTYVYAPVLLEDVTDEYETYSQSLVGAYKADIDYMSDMYIYDADIEEIDYDNEKEAFEKDGYKYITEEQFDDWFGDGELTSREVEELYAAILKDDMVEHIIKSNNGMDFSLFKVEKNYDGVDWTQVCIAWTEDGRLSAVWLESTTEEWAQMGMATLMSIHKK